MCLLFLPVPRTKQSMSEPKTSATTSVLVVLSTTPTQQAARQLAQTLVQERHAACCTILPAVGSVYRWQGKVEESEEVLVLIKTTQEQYPQLQQRIQELHPYQLPEIIALPVVAGLAEYLGWVADSVGGQGTEGGDRGSRK